MQLDHIKNIVKKSGTTFYWGMRILPKKKSNSMFIIYAFCRIVDDISDGKLNKMKKMKRGRSTKIILGAIKGTGGAVLRVGARGAVIRAGPHNNLIIWQIIQLQLLKLYFESFSYFSNCYSPQFTMLTFLSKSPR